MNNLQTRFKKQIAGELQKELSLKNVMAVPALSKIVVNMGVKDAIADKKNLEKSSLISLKQLLLSGEATVMRLGKNRF